MVLRRGGALQSWQLQPGFRLPIPGVASGGQGCVCSHCCGRQSLLHIDHCVTVCFASGHQCPDTSFS